ncbi:NfeD family protein [Salinisphaera sp. LB1]|uniref:NfeD family protein n=1 Tax=Salinisphaera sp. LB1 TaxID=2183911 RepID=UPI000D708646|nr:NfeD family protein [Salinisphaera sp. LB1]AWN14461.1 hypothetical protein SALB1_0254 [Salinisphaera sp. LB1]
MCHIILFLPLLALPVFWLLPLVWAIPLYLTALAVSAWLYWIMLRGMQRPVMAGPESLLNRHGQVTQCDGGFLMVQIHNELWKATSDDDSLHNGDKIIVIGRHGLVVHVSRDRLDQPASIACRGHMG